MKFNHRSNSLYQHQLERLLLPEFVLSISHLHKITFYMYNGAVLEPNSIIVCEDIRYVRRTLHESMA